MKKNISINISGIIFHIEEDGYDKLKNYLTSISVYFSSYEDSDEIIADIENRIAEIFLGKLSDLKQVITYEDVEALIATMGTVSDFAAAEENYYEDARFSSFQQGGSSTTYETPAATQTATSAPERKLCRDLNRKIAGGVASGIAHYIGIDPLWIRLLFLGIGFGLLPFTKGISGIVLLVYIVLWITLPGAKDLEYDQKIKRLFRNPGRRVLGGVASGISAYFGTDLMVIRLLFIGGMLAGGSSVLAYIILWIITPEAKTITEKMQMEGEPVTLENIEKKIKENLNINENEKENMFTRIVLLPFRLISMVIHVLSTVLRPVAAFVLQTLRIIMGSSFTLISALLTFVFAVMLMVMLGAYNATPGSNFEGLPVELIRNSFSPLSFVSVFLTVVIPALALGIAGISILANRRVFNPTIGWSAFGLWIVGIMGTIYSIPGYASAFNTAEVVKNTLTYKAEPPVLTLGLHEITGGEHEFTSPELTIKGHKENEIKLVEHFGAHGTDPSDALKNAQMIEYKVENKEGALIFDHSFSFKAGSLFRGQDVRLDLFIPFGKEFILKEELGQILRNTLHPHGYSSENLSDTTRWVFDQNGLKCINCVQQPKMANGEVMDSEELEGFTLKADHKDFTEVSMIGAFNVHITKGDQYQVLINGDEDLVKRVKITQDKGKINVGFQEGAFQTDDMEGLSLMIVMPSLTSLEAQGAHEIELSGFDEKTMNINFAGAIDCKADMNVKELRGVLHGNSELELKGQGDVMDIKLTGASELNAFEFIANDVQVESAGDCDAEVFAKERLQTDNSGASELKYMGDPKVLKGTGEFEKYEEGE